jgi:hypothetical protein
MLKTIERLEALRKQGDKDWTLSNFYFDGVFTGVGVEDEHNTIKAKGQTKVPNGIYPLGLKESPKFSYSFYRDSEGNIIDAKSRNTIELQRQYSVPHEMIWVMNAPGFDHLFWRWSDGEDESGFIVGDGFGEVKSNKNIKKEAVLDSKKKYMEIYPILFRSIRDKTLTQVEYKDEPKILE